MIEKIKNTEIDTYELENNSPSYTWHTVQHIKAKFQDSIITMVIGGDLVSKLHTWNKIDELSQEKTEQKTPKINNKPAKLLLQMAEYEQYIISPFLLESNEKN